MKRLYYLVSDLHRTKEITSHLKGMGVGSSNLYVWSNDVTGLKEQDINPVGFVDKLDIVHSGEQGAILGLIFGVLFCVGIAIFEPFSVDVGWAVAGLVVILMTLFGAWVGGMIGTSVDNYKLSKFHNKIDQGKHLVVVEVGQKNEGLVKTMMARHHQDATLEGVDTTSVNPWIDFPFQHLR